VSRENREPRKPLFCILDASILEFLDTLITMSVPRLDSKLIQLGYNCAPADAGMWSNALMTVDVQVVFFWNVL
jgi:hypothetical protein